MYGITLSNKIIVSPFDPAVRINGRFSKRVIKEEVVARTSFSGTAFTVAFEGTEAAILLKSPGNVFGVALDEKQMPPLDLSTDSGEKHIVAKGLEDGVHVLTVAKRTESSQGDDVFRGFEIAGIPQKEALPPEPKIKIEFLGDSITAGYGVLDQVKEHPYSPITEDVFSSYAGVAARELRAEMRTVAFSGRGIYRNHPDSKDSRPLPDFFPYISVNNNIPWDFSWQPDFAVINLGSNDFFEGVPDSEMFINSMIKFAKQVNGKYPQAKIVIIDGPMLNDSYPDGVQSLTICRKFLDAAKGELARQGLAVYRFSLSPQDGSLGYGADWHPGGPQSEKNGRELAEFLWNTFPQNLS